MGLLGHLLNSAHDARCGHVRYPHQSYNQLPARPFELVFELFPGLDINSCGRGDVEHSCNIETFQHLLDARRLMDQQRSLS